LHLLALLMLGRMQIGGRYVDAVTRAPRFESEPSIRIFELIPIPADALTGINAVLPEPPATRTASVRPRGAPETAMAEGAIPRAISDEDIAGSSSRLRPATPDPRLRRSLVDVLQPDPDQPHIPRARLDSQLGAYNDSVSKVAKAAEKSEDWTTADNEGRRWGVSPETVHLGVFAMRLRFCTAGPCPDRLFTPPAGRRDELDKRLHTFEEIRRGAARAEADASFSERVNAVRAHEAASRDSVRAQRR
jgi:hypothetical protein